MKTVVLKGLLAYGMQADKTHEHVSCFLSKQHPLVLSRLVIAMRYIVFSTSLTNSAFIVRSNVCYYLVKLFIENKLNLLLSPDIIECYYNHLYYVSTAIKSLYCVTEYTL